MASRHFSSSGSSSESSASPLKNRYCPSPSDMTFPLDETAAGQWLAEKCQQILRDNPRECRLLDSNPDSFSVWLTAQMRREAFKKWEGRLRQHHYSLAHVLCLAEDSGDRRGYVEGTFWNAEADRKITARCMFEGTVVMCNVYFLAFSCVEGHCRNRRSASSSSSSSSESSSDSSSSSGSEGDETSGSVGGDSSGSDSSSTEDSETESESESSTSGSESSSSSSGSSSSSSSSSESGSSSTGYDTDSSESSSESCFSVSSASVPPLDESSEQEDNF